jgi:iron(III) transport system substrate-binding protein
LSIIHRSIRQLRRRTLIALTAGLFIGSSLAACSSSGTDNAGSTSSAPAVSANESWSDIVAAANKEGSVEVYSAQAPTIVASISAAFEKEYPHIKLNVFKTLGNTLVTRLQTDQRAGKADADVVEAAPAAFTQTEIAAGQVDTSANPPAVKDYSSVAFSKGVGAEDLIVPVLIYNTKLVSKSEAPTTWQDLLNPKWKGKISLYEPIPNLTEVYEYWMETYGPNFLTELAAQDPRMYASGTDNDDAVSSGAEYVGVTLINHAGNSISSGAPLDYVLPSKTPVTPANVYITSNAPHPDAALVYLNFVMSHEGQEAINGNLGGSSAISGVSGSLPSPSDPVVLNESKVTADYSKIRSLMGLGVGS